MKTNLPQNLKDQAQTELMLKLSKQLEQFSTQGDSYQVLSDLKTLKTHTKLISEEVKGLKSGGESSKTPTGIDKKDMDELKSYIFSTHEKWGKWLHAEMKAKEGSFVSEETLLEIQKENRKLKEELKLHKTLMWTFLALAVCFGLGFLI